MQYSLQYSYVSSSEILSATSVVARSNHTITNSIDVQYGLLNNVTTSIHVPYVYVYDKSGSATAKDNTDMGDVSLNLSYQPFKSGGDWPTTTITMGATLPTGRSPYKINRDTDLPTGGGLYGVSLGVNMSKSIDPAMAFGSISCSYRLERDDLSQNIGGAMLEAVKPGMSYQCRHRLGLRHLLRSIDERLVPVRIRHEHGLSFLEHCCGFDNAVLQHRIPRRRDGLARFAVNDAVVRLVYRIDEQ